MKVIKIDKTAIYFNDSYKLFSYHYQLCCKEHYLNFENLNLEDFDGLEFDLLRNDFFEYVPQYGIWLKPINGFPVFVPSYNYNNGWVNDDLILIIEHYDSIIRKYDAKKY